AAREDRVAGGKCHDGADGCSGSIQRASAGLYRARYIDFLQEPSRILSSGDRGETNYGLRYQARGLAAAFRMEWQAAGHWQCGFAGLIDYYHLGAAVSRG